MVFEYVAVVRKGNGGPYRAIHTRSLSDQTTAVAIAEERGEERIRVGHTVDASSSIAVDTLVIATAKGEHEINMAGLERAIRLNPLA